MDERWTDVDLPALLSRAAQPMFLLNERGAVVYANAALHEAFGVPFGNRVGWRELEAVSLKAPADLPPGGARQFDLKLPSGDWMQAVIHSLTDPASGTIGVLGVLRPMEKTPAAPVSNVNLFARWERLREDQRVRYGFDVCPGRSDAGGKLLQQLRIATVAETPALFVGGSGVGKLTLAKVLHHQSRDRGWSATLDADALNPEEQLEFLIGDEGALKQQGAGRLIVRGLLSLPLEVQQTIAELHESPGRRWRLLATEREPLEAALADGRVHPPLYYIATRFVIDVPSLKDRRDDVADFAALWLRQRANERGGTIPTPTVAAVAALERYDWPGNLREFTLAMSSAVEKAAGGTIEVSHLPPRIARGPAYHAEAVKPPPLDALMESLERRMMRSAHALFKGNKTKAAEHLGVSRARFIRRWEQLKLDGPADDEDDFVELTEEDGDA